MEGFLLKQNEYKRGGESDAKSKKRIKTRRSWREGFHSQSDTQLEAKQSFWRMIRQRGNNIYSVCVCVCVAADKGSLLGEWDTLE